MALIKAEDLIDARLGSMLKCDHCARSRRQNLVVSRILKLAILLVAGTFSRILTPVEAVAERCAFCLCQILFDVVVYDFVGLDVLLRRG